MTIRLNKVTRDLNVGISTVVEFLQKKGYSIEANPNTKITEEQYAILVKEFSTDKNLKKESEKFIQERQNKDRNKASISIEGYEEPKKEEVVKTVVPEDARPKFKPVGKIDLDNLNKKSVAPKVEEKTEEPEQIEVVVEKQPEPVKVVEEIAPVKEEKQPEPIKIIEEKQGNLIITADHGNAEQMIDYKTGEPHTAHTTSPVPLILVSNDETLKIKSGKLADLAPTLLEILGIAKPEEMTGESILVK